MNVAYYPFKRTPRQKFSGFEKYYCKICNSHDYAQPGSKPFDDQICMDCGREYVTGKDLLNPLNCAIHGEYIGWLSRRYNRDKTIGDCPICERLKRESEERKEVKNSNKKFILADWAIPIFILLFIVFIIMIGSCAVSKLNNYTDCLNENFDYSKFSSFICS